MQLTILLPAIVTVLYMGTCVAHLWKHEWALAVVWGGYALANIGLIASQLR